MGEDTEKWLAGNQFGYPPNRIDLLTSVTGLTFPAQAGHYDLLILDLMLPDMDGVD